ncbi:MAG: hypothetical protein KDA21_04780 [Phycisphaerales bacterium]|nr:hypothetical protein [Phycisphaerales bacterium]
MIESLQVRDTGAVRVLTLSRPERLNALDHLLRRAIIDALADAAGDDPWLAHAVAALRGVSRYTISRRVRQLTRRATDERFVWAAGCLTEWPALRAEVARACILRGIPLRDAATQLMVSQHTVRNELAVINALFRESQGVDA